MSFDFPTETITEGKIKALVPKLAAYKTKPNDYAPSKTPVFYNPTMELNRDLAVLALQTHQKLSKKQITACEPLTGSGLRGARFATEIENIHKVFLNDIKPESAKLATFNAKLNNVTDIVEVSNEDANLFLSKNAAPKKRFNYIDVDPFGAPVPYLDAAIRALRNDGMLALTATDMAPLCGVHPRACLRKYGGQPLRTEYCHELAIRLLIGCLTMMAAKHAIGIEPMFSHSVDHYIRAYATVHYGAKIADKSVKQMGYILHCFSCFHRETVQGIASPSKQVCPSCGAKLSIAGPLWLGNIANKNFCSMMIKEVDKRNLKLQKRLHKTLALICNEVEAPATYYTTDRICDKLNLPIPSLKKVMENITKQGFQTVLTHFNSTGFRTDAPAKTITQTITKLATKKN
jgi:tRNA (guanine26-N2/guanine27-N2)-dimethyltransferase